jgi:hypothetical protein
MLTLSVTQQNRANCDIVPFAWMAGRGRGVQKERVRSKGRSARIGGGARVVQVGRRSHSGLVTEWFTHAHN